MLTNPAGVRSGRPRRPGLCIWNPLAQGEARAGSGWAGRGGLEDHWESGIRTERALYGDYWSMLLGW